MDHANGQTSGMDSGDGRTPGAVVASGSARMVPDGTRGAVSESATYLSIIERFARDPSVDIDRVERFLKLHQDAEAKRAKGEFLAAFSMLQGELPAAVRRGTGHNNKKYARFEDIVDVLRPLLLKHGFSLSHRMNTQGNRIVVTGILGHASGHSEQTEMELQPDTSGGKTNVHAMASAVSYGKRYTALMLTGIATEGEDDDARKASAKEPEAVATVDDLRKLIDDTKSAESWFLQNYSVETLDDLTAKQRTEAHAMLRNKAAKIGGRK